LRSSLLTRLDFRHGFSLRAGGVSVGPYASLNLGRSVGDEPEAVRDNHRLLAQDIGYDAARLYEVRQVHGAQVERARAQDDAELFRTRPADALISQDCALAIKVADCVSVLLADPRTGAVAAVHAGWRGVVANVVDSTVEALSRAYGSRPAQLVSAVFPCIGLEAFEVSEEVAAQVARAVGSPEVWHAREPRPHVDLARSVALQLARAGLGPEQIDLIAGCTFDDSARFFSFRRDGGVTGRHLAAIIPRC
jgi:YfiH family protein